MSGWIKLEKDRRDDPRVIRMARELRHASVTHERFMANALVTLVLGCLDVLWCYADTHIREDDTLDLGVDEIDELVGLKGFCRLLPTDWLEIIDANSVKLPDFHAHNGTESKRKALSQKRSERYRNAEALQAVTPASRTSVTTALPDQDQDQDQTKTRPKEDIRRSETDAPKRNGVDRGLETQIVAAYHELLPSLPGVKVWNDKRHRKLSDRIRERVAAGKPADTVDYWRSLFSKAAQSDFLCGRSRADWRCPGLEWLLEPRNFTKLIEGSYDNAGAANGRG